jgi:hypothetical protein
MSPPSAPAITSATTSGVSVSTKRKSTVTFCAFWTTKISRSTAATAST